MSMDRITQAAQAMEDLTSDFAAMDITLEAKKAEIDQFLLNARQKIGTPDQLIFDGATIFSKTSLNLATDNASPSRTVWHELPPIIDQKIYGVSAVNNFAALSLSRDFQSPPGYYEANKFQVDWSLTDIEFVVAPAGGANQISAFIAAQAITPAIAGFGGFRASALIVPILDIAPLATGRALFMRFKNKALTAQPEVPDDFVPQAIAQFGGNTSFAINTLSIYQK